MIVEFCRWGNSLAVRIPKTVADALKVSNGKRAEIKVENGTLVLRPIVKPARKPRHTLDDLLSGMTKDDAPDYADYADDDDYAITVTVHLLLLGMTTRARRAVWHDARGGLPAN